MATYTGDSGDNNYTGTVDADQATGGGGNDVLNGLGGDDTLDGDDGNDTLDGGTHNDVLTGGAGLDSLSGGEGDDRLYSGTRAASEPAWRDSGPSLDRTTEIDTLNGGAGDDIIFAGVGDSVDGGATGSYGDVLNISFMGASAGVTADFRLFNTQSAITINGGTITGIEETAFIEGSDFDDLLAGWAGTYYPTGNWIYGRGGNDHLIAGYYAGWAGSSLSGGDGDDLIDLTGAGYGPAAYGDAGNDTIIGGSSYERLEGGEGNDVLQGNYGYDWLLGGGGDDNLEGGSFDDTIYGDDGNDVIYGAGDLDSIFGGAGNDVIYGDYSLIYSGNALSPSRNDDVLKGEAGSDVIHGDWGNDQIDGGTEDDILYGDDGNDAIVGGDGNDTIDGGADSDTLYGGLGNDDLRSGAGTDQLSGEAGDDTLYFGSTFGSGDIAAGGEGYDTLVLQGSYQQVSITSAMMSGIDAIRILSAADDSFGHGAPVQADPAFRLIVADGTIAGGAFLDIVASGRSSAEWVTVFFNEADARLRFQGGDEENAVYGGGASDILRGGGGNDQLDGRGGADVMIGGAGDDFYTVDNSGDVVDEESDSGSGIDGVTSSIDYTLGTGVEILLLAGTAVTGAGNSLDNVVGGNALANVLYGYGGDDTLQGDGGADQLYGGTGNDTYNVDDDIDTVTELAGEGTDTVYASVGYTLGDNVENLTLVGGASINGTGNYLANIITGNSGANILDGGGDVDTLIGGAGDDIYLLDSSAETVTELAGEGTDEVRIGSSYVLGANLERLTLTGSDNSNGTGNELNNLMTGNSGNNVLNGMGGADVLVGGLGDDTYVVDAGADVINEAAGEGDDLVLTGISWTLGANIERLTLTGTGNITAVGNGLDNVLLGNSGNNTLSGGAGADSMTGGLGNDIYIVDDAGDVVTEGASGGMDTVQTALSYTLGANLESLTLTGTAAVNGTGNALDNFIIGNSAANVLTGNAGNDTLNGGLGADNMAGGIGNDTYVVDEAGDVVTEASGAGTDTVQSAIGYTLGANLEVLTLTGSAAINGTGNALANVLNGNAGANTLDGGAGADSMFGGNGDDIYIVSDLGDRATEVSAAGGFDTVMSAISFYMTSNIEKIVLTGTAATTAVGTATDNIMIGNVGNNTFVGGGGNDTMTGGLGNDIYYVDQAGDVVNENAGEGTDTVIASLSYTLGATLENLTLTGAAALNGTGNDLNNIITGNSGANTLNGGIGNDTLIGGVGNDTLIGGVGNDTYVIDGGDTLVEAAGEGTDTVQSAISYTLLTNFEVLTLTGTANLNGTGNAADNSLNGNSGNNILDGGAGADGMFGGLGNDTYIVDNAGDKAVETSAVGGTDEVKSSVTFVLGGNVENLTLTGSAAVNGFGNTLDNVITGNSGNNNLAGGAGADTLDGKGGIDSFLYTNTSDSTSAAMDHILGFTAGEKIDLSGIDASTTAAGNNAFAFVGAAAFTGTAGELRAYQSGSEWFVEGDTNGDGTADLVISVASDHALVAADFVV